MKLNLVILSVVLVFSSFVYGIDLNNEKKAEELGYIPGEVIIRYKDVDEKASKGGSRSIMSVDEQLEQNNLKIVEELDKTLNISLLEIEDDKSVEETIKILEENPLVEYAEPNYIRYFHDEGNNTPIELGDPYKNDQWSLKYIDWDDAFMLYSGSLKNTDVVVGIMDNGVNYNHPDLSGSMWNSPNGKCKMKLNGYIFDNYDCVHGYDFNHIASTPLPNDNHHGTHLAGIVGATVNNGIGIVGVNPYAKIASLKVGKSTTIATSAEIRAIDFAIENGIKILNASFGSESKSPAEWDAIDRYRQFGGLFVTSAGNNGVNIDAGSFTNCPCSYDLPNIICVASMTSNGQLADSSNFGKNSVDIAAPGRYILSTSIKASNLNWIYSDNFESNQGESWSGGDYYDLGNGARAYKFQGEMSSNSGNIKLAGKENVSLSFKLKCSLSGENVDLYFVKGNGSNRVKTIVASDEFQTVNMDMYAQYYVDDFSFRLVSGGQGEYCLVDDVSLNGNQFYYDMPDDYYVQAGGTSMAAPHVAALASLVWAIKPNLTYSEVKDLILSNGNYNPNFSGLTVTEKYINVKKTLDAVVDMGVSPVKGLTSSRTGVIKWNYNDNLNYYYEVLDSENSIVQSGNVESGGEVETHLEGNYVWRVKGIDDFGNESEFSTGYICAKPVLTGNHLSGVFSGYECSELEGNLNYTDNCSDGYEVVWSDGNGTAVLNGSGTINKEVYLRNSFGEESDHLSVNYIRSDSLPTMDKINYEYPSTITSTSQKNIGNVISLFGIVDGACGANSITVVSAQCSQGESVISPNNRLYVTVPSNKQGNVTCTITFEDDENNQVTGNLTYSFNTVQNQTNGGGGSTGGGSTGGGSTGGGSTGGGSTGGGSTGGGSTGGGSTGGGSTGGGSTGGGSTGGGGFTDTEPKKQTTVTTGTQTDVKVDQQVKQIKQPESQNQQELETKDSHGSSDSDFSWFNNSNSSSVLSNGYTVEFNNAYEFAHRAGITTISNIEKADMNGMLTRIAMAKMLSQYAVNILGKQPDKSKRINFVDVPSSLDKDYNDGVTLAYQLGIMGIGINKFRPYDTVTRAEFGTALSRMLYGTKDGTNNYYSTHLAKLREEGVISNVNPYLKELRGYVMIMLMRSAKK